MAQTWRDETQCTIMYEYMSDQSLRPGKAKQLHPKTTPFSQENKRAASGGIQTCDVLRTRQTLYQLNMYTCTYSLLGTFHTHLLKLHTYMHTYM